MTEVSRLGAVAPSLTCNTSLISTWSSSVATKGREVGGSAMFIRLPNCNEIPTWSSVLSLEMAVVFEGTFDTKQI